MGAKASPATREGAFGGIGGRASPGLLRSKWRIALSMGGELWKVSGSSVKYTCCSSDFDYVHVDLKTFLILFFLIWDGENSFVDSIYVVIRLSRSSRGLISS